MKPPLIHQTGPPPWPRTRPNNHFQNLSRSSQPLSLPPPSRREGLTAIPSTPSSIFTSPFLPLLVPSVLLELLRPPNRTLPVPVSPDKREEMSYRMKVYDDESVDGFLSRRFGRKVARVLGSAMVHGIWAADSRELSVRASFPSLWDVEERGWGGVIRGILRGLPKTGAEGERYKVGELLHRLKGVSVFSFRDGMESLPKRLLGRLRESPNVQVLLGTAVKSLQPEGSGIGVSVHSSTMSHTYEPIFS
jgi:oxygen-dependent protoporphyrinogen oxidase